MSDEEQGKDGKKLPAAFTKKMKKKGRKHKPKGYPKRPLSAYNMFFREERQKVLNLDFQTMGKEISTRWRNTSTKDRERFDEMAKEDALRYKNEVQLFGEEEVLANRRKRELLEKEEQLKLKGLNSPKLLPDGNILRIKEGVQEFSSSANTMAAITSLRMEEQEQWEGHASRQELAISHLRQLSPLLSSTPRSGSNNGPPGDAMAQMEASWRQQQINAMLLADERNEMEARSLRMRMALANMPYEQQVLGLDGASRDGLAPAILERLRRQALAALGAGGGSGGMLPSSGPAYSNSLSSSMFGGGGLIGIGSLPPSSILQLTGGRAYAPPQISLDRTYVSSGGVSVPAGFNFHSELALSRASAAEKEAFLRDFAQRHSNFS